MAIFDDLQVGQDLPELAKGVITRSHIMRWSAAIENWHRVHYDRDYAVGRDGLPDVLINGSWKQHVLIELVSSWARPDGWPWKVTLSFRSLNLPGETITAWGRVVGLERRGAFGLAELAIGLRNGAGAESTPGSATVVLQRRDGPKVPYPFDPACLDAAAVARAR